MQLMFYLYRITFKCNFRFYYDTGETDMAKGLNLIHCNSAKGLGSGRSSTNLFQPLSLSNICESALPTQLQLKNRNLFIHTQNSILDEPHKYTSKIYYFVY